MRVSCIYNAALCLFRLCDSRFVNFFYFVIYVLQILLLWCISHGLPSLAGSAGILSGNCTTTELVAYLNWVGHRLRSCCRNL